MCVCVCMGACVCVCVCVCMCVCMCMCVCLYVYMSVCLHACMCGYVRGRVERIVQYGEKQSLEKEWIAWDVVVLRIGCALQYVMESMG